LEEILQGVHMLRHNQLKYHKKKERLRKKQERMKRKEEMAPQEESSELVPELPALSRFIDTTNTIFR